ncbi:MAG: hypothetical protein BroJett006_30920 [Betaproteobacteria bacterium]|nr:MAG: hypothetical protein BroJett006_30920 [Betaproteobacteria bacterium]
MAIRIRSRFHAGGRERSLAELASVVAMLSWKLAIDSIKRMRGAKFDIDLGRPYFDYVVETMAFHAHYADRVAYEKLGPEPRGEFTIALARRMAEAIEDNADMLLTASEPGACRRHFLEVFNAAGADYAEYSCDEKGPDFGFRRAYAARVREGMPEKDKNWVYDQVMEIEAPEGVKAIQKTLDGLFGGGEKPARRAREGLSGE